MPGDSRDLDALQDSVNHAAVRAQAVWISLLTVSVYLFVSIGTVTDEHIFFEKPLKVPLLNVDLPLVGFFIVTPSMYLVLHIGLLIQLSILAFRIRTWLRTLEEKVLHEEDRDSFRHRLDSFLFVQILGGFVASHRKGVVFACLNFVAIITVVYFPLIVFAQHQLIFLPYQSSLLTSYHQILMIVDVVAVFVLVPGIYGHAAGLSWSWFRMSIRHPATIQFKGVFAWMMVPTSLLMIILLASEVYCESDPLGCPLLKSTLDLSGKYLADEAILARMEQREKAEYRKPGTYRYLHDMKDRSLQGLRLNHSVLPRTDFRGANLAGASFVSAALDKSNFGCPMNQTRDTCTNASGADFSNALLNEANFERTIVTSASFSGAHLVAANLSSLQGHGACFERADLRAADLNQAKVVGAGFQDADLRGASLYKADVRGAVLERAIIKVVWLQHATFGMTIVSSREELVSSILAQPPVYDRTFDTASLLPILQASVASRLKRDECDIINRSESIRRRVQGRHRETDGAVDHFASLVTCPGAPSHAAGCTITPNRSGRLGDADRKSIAKTLGKALCEPYGTAPFARGLARNGIWCATGEHAFHLFESLPDDDQHSPAASDDLSVTSDRTCLRASSLTEQELLRMRVKVRRWRSLDMTGAWGSDCFGPDRAS